MVDGLIDLRVEEKLAERLSCRVVSGGTIQSHKGVNLPASNLRISAVTDKDLADLAFGLEQGVDFVALSFVRHENDLLPVRAMLDRSKPRPLLIAKIEKSQAVARLEHIMAEVDGLMVARGDLGVEMPLEEVPITQKKIIRTARQAGKPVITATQMLLSMVTNPRPTRAEVTDVANAILDGTDALMLSDETTLGAHPVEAVAVLDRIARSTEPYMDEQAFLNEAVTDFLPVTATAISRAACWLAQDLRAAAIVASTSSGSTARLVARFRPSCPVVALTPELATQRQLSLSWGVIADLVPSFGTTDQMFVLARSWALAKGIAAPTDRLVITAGIPVGVSGTTNLVKVLELARSLEPLDDEADK
jgi:pyruvate kinase